MYVQVGEDHVDHEDEFAQCCREEGRDEAWDEEDHGEDGLLVVSSILI